MAAHSAGAATGCAGDWVVVEADESDGSFLRLPATIAVLTNADPDHLDYYGTFDRMREAQQQVAADGVSFRDRFGQVKAHPLLTVERDARAAFLAGLRSLNLDLEPLHDGPGRPPGSTSRNQDG